MSRSHPVPPTREGTFRFPGAVGATYAVGRTPAVDVLRAIRRTTDTLSVDTETFGLGTDALDLKCVQIGTATDVAVLDPRDEFQAGEIRRALDGARHLVFHNSPFDVTTLYANGLMTIEDIDKVTDTLIYARLAEPDSIVPKSLLKAGQRYLGTSGEDALLIAFRESRMSKAQGFLTFDLDRPMYVEGAASDVIITARLLPLVRAAALRMLTEGHPFTRYGVKGDAALELLEREQIINRMMLRRTARGLGVDLDYLDSYRDATARRADELAEVVTAAGVKPGHAGQLAAWLEKEGALPEGYPYTAKTNVPSTRADDLKTVHHPVARAFTEWKQITKVEHDYLQKVADSAGRDGRVHPQVNILAAATGRMSYANPPFQQFNGPARGIVLADEGDSLVSIDWSQIEPVVAANVAGDLGALAGYETGDADLYKEVGRLAGIERKSAKVMLLALMYGQGMTRLSAETGMSIEEAWELRRKIFRTMPKVAELITKLKGLGDRHGKVFTLSGRIVPIPMARTPEGSWKRASYKAVNYFVQGSAYDVLADTLVRVERAGLGDAVYLAMHDELVVGEDAAQEVDQIMRTPPERLVMMARRTPVLRTDVKELGERWADA